MRWLSLANTSYQGQYIFGGSQTATAPFTHFECDHAGHGHLQRRRRCELSADAQRAEDPVECAGGPDFHGGRNERACWEF